MGYAYTIHWFYHDSPHPSPTKCPSTYVWWRFQISLWCYTYRFAIQVQFSSVSQLYLTLCESMDCSTPGFPVHHQPLELAQTHVHQVGDSIQLSHPLLSPSPPAFNLSQHQGLFQWVRSLHQVAKVFMVEAQVLMMSRGLCFSLGSACSLVSGFLRLQPSVFSEKLASFGGYLWKSQGRLWLASLNHVPAPEQIPLL